MLAEQRQTEILRELSRAGGVRVTALAQQLRVALETVRRDLERLEREGKLVRTHGGAVPVAAGEGDVPFVVRRTANHEAKVAVARHAIRYLAEGDVIGLDASSTVHELTRLIPDIPLTVVTNSLLAVVRLASRHRVRVIATGGALDPASYSWTGTRAEDGLRDVNIGTLFLSSKGVDLERGLSERDDAQARLKRRMMDRAARRILLVDRSKFGLRSTVSFAPLSDVQLLVTDAATVADGLEIYAAAGPAIEIASEPEAGSFP
jgi:DeoR/GlpR family transcriptional regulator of sugar metabolism